MTVRGRRERLSPALILPGLPGVAYLVLPAIMQLRKLQKQFHRIASRKRGQESDFQYARRRESPVTSVLCRGGCIPAAP